MLRCSFVSFFFLLSLCLSLFLSRSLLFILLSIFFFLENRTLCRNWKIERSKKRWNYCKCWVRAYCTDKDYAYSLFYDPPPGHRSRYRDRIDLKFAWSWLMSPALVHVPTASAIDKRFVHSYEKRKGRSRFTRSSSLYILLRFIYIYYVSRANRNLINSWWFFGFIWIF